MRSLTRIVGGVYRRHIRPLLPDAGPVMYAGVPTPRRRKLGDLHIPAFLRPHDVLDIPTYEGALTQGLSAQVRPGDRVVIVGGGEGVTVALAAKAAAPGGSVICYEGAATQVSQVEATAEVNGVSQSVTVRHAIVGAAVHVYGDAATHADAIVPATGLPECDVLELDCEGAERQILGDMSIRPRAIIVETHGLFGSPTADVRRLLESAGYAVEDLGWAEPGLLDQCRSGDVRVLSATRP